MRFGVKIPNLSALASRGSIIRTAVTAEDGGYEAIWASDHLVFARSTVHRADGRRFPVPFDVPAVDPIVALSVAAGATDRIRLGTSVLVAANRSPVAIAKAWASLDLLAPGRVVAGIGTGWQQEEFEALGAGDRFRRRGTATEEAIEILRRCWSDPEPSFRGEFHDIEPLHFRPQPERPIPIILGGSSERGIGRVGRCGDGFHGTNLTPAAAAEVIDRIRQAAADADRDPEALWFTTLVEMEFRSDGPRNAEDDAGVHLVGSADRMVERVAAFAEAGIEHLALRVRSLSGSTRPGVAPALDLERGLDEIRRFAREVAGSPRPSGPVSS